MEIRKFEINGRQVEFVNQCRGTRNGFAHDTTMFVNGCNYGEATCHYLNRTWERYTYQSVMRKVVYEERDAYVEREKNRFKAVRGYNKLTAKRQEEFTEYLKTDEQLQFYDALLKALA